MHWQSIIFDNGSYMLKQADSSISYTPVAGIIPFFIIILIAQSEILIFILYRGESPQKTQILISDRPAFWIVKLTRSTKHRDLSRAILCDCHVSTPTTCSSGNLTITNIECCCNRSQKLSMRFKYGLFPGHSSRRINGILRSRNHW